MKSLEIKTKRNKERLCAYEDCDDRADLESYTVSFLYVPNTKKEEHFHIDLTMKEAEKLKNYLIAVLENQ